VLVPGSEWGDETGWLAAIAGAFAGSAPSLTVVVNGGDVARRDAEASVAARRPVLALAGSGRTADALATAASGLVRSAPFDDPEAVATALRRELGATRPPPA
jgi:hypothetical protein